MSRKKGRRGGQGPRPPQQHPPEPAPVEAPQASPEPVLEAVEASAEPSNVVSLTSFGANASYRSMKGLSDILGVDRSTIDKWVKLHNCPYEAEASARAAATSGASTCPPCSSGTASGSASRPREV